MRNPKFESLPTKVIPVKVDGVIYNAFPMFGTFEDLKNVKYGEGFIQGTFGHQFALVHGAYLNPKNTDAQNIVLITKNNNICGNTILYGKRELIFAVDFPEFIGGRIGLLTEQDLTSKLSSRQEGDVFFSEDGLVRAIPRANLESGYNFQIASSTYPILLTGDRTSPQKSAEILTILQRPALFLVPSTGIVTVPCLDAIAIERLDLGGNHRHSMISLGEKCSFAVSK